MNGRHCPDCQRVLYDRRRTRCGHCGAAVPETLQFDAEEIETLDRKAARWEQYRVQRAADESADEETKRRQRNDSGTACG